MPNSSEKNKDKPELSGILGTLKFIQDKDARLGLVASIFVLLVLASSWFIRSYGGIATEDGLFGIFSTLFYFLIASAGFLIFFKAIDGTIVPRVIVWYFKQYRC